MHVNAAIMILYHNYNVSNLWPLCLSGRSGRPTTTATEHNSNGPGFESITAPACTNRHNTPADPVYSKHSAPRSDRHRHPHRWNPSTLFLALERPYTVPLTPDQSVNPDKRRPHCSWPTHKKTIVFCTTTSGSGPAGVVFVSCYSPLQETAFG